MRCVERKNHGTLAGELHKLLELFGGVDLVSPGGSRAGLLATLFASRLYRIGVQFHRVAYGGGNLLRCTVLCCTALGKVTLHRVLGCTAVCRIKNDAHPGLLYVLYLLLRVGSIVACRLDPSRVPSSIIPTMGRCERELSAAYALSSCRD